MFYRFVLEYNLRIENPRMEGSEIANLKSDVSISCINIYSPSKHLTYVHSLCKTFYLDPVSFLVKVHKFG